MTKFLAIDVETANYDRTSIIQIAIVTFEDGRITDTWQTLVNPGPGVAFYKNFVALHHINKERVAGAPAFPQIAAHVRGLLDGQIVVSHTNFDKDALSKIFAKHKIPSPDYVWIDSCTIARKVWPRLENHKLNTLAAHLGITFQHHNALEDARACGLILARAATDSGNPLSHWVNPPRRSRKFRQEEVHVATVNIPASSSQPITWTNPTLAPPSTLHTPITLTSSADSPATPTRPTASGASDNLLSQTVFSIGSVRFSLLGVIFLCACLCLASPFLAAPFLPKSAATPTVQYHFPTASAVAALKLTGTPTPAASATATPSPAPTRTATPIPPGCINFQLITSDPPAGSSIPNAATFVQTWTVSNTGACSWDGVRLVHLSGDALAGEPVILPATAPGAVTEIRLSLIAPSAAGIYTGAWALSYGSLITGALMVNIETP